MKEERTLDTRQIFDGRAIRLRVDTVEKPDGSKTSREIVEHDECIAVVPINDKREVILVRQFRKPVERELLEIPAGGIEPGETPDQAVYRELQEEIGLLPRKVEHIGGFFAAPGYTTEYLYLYVATDFVQSRLHAEDTDEIEVVRVPLNDIPSLISSGKICDAKSIVGLLRFLHERVS